MRVRRQPGLDPRDASSPPRFGSGPWDVEAGQLVPIDSSEEQLLEMAMSLPPMRTIKPGQRRKLSLELAGQRATLAEITRLMHVVTAPTPCSKAQH